MEMERFLLDALIEDINSTFMCNLALEYCTSRDGTANISSNMATVNTRYVVIGASHAGRLASALKEMGSEVADLSVPG
jgi:MoaA/NifB/PqqE/SkfB family radical SAM enzyme